MKKKQRRNIKGAQDTQSGDTTFQATKKKKKLK